MFLKNPMYVLTCWYCLACILECLVQQWNIQQEMKKENMK